jgi:hypothetical protein
MYVLLLYMYVWIIRLRFRELAATREADELLQKEQLRVQDRQAAAIEEQTAVMKTLLAAMLQQQAAAAKARE